MLTVAQVADRLQVSAALVYQWVESCMLACYRLGGKGKRGAIRVSEEQLQLFLETQKKGQPAVKPAAPRIIKPASPPLQNLKLKPS